MLNDELVKYRLECLKLSYDINFKKQKIRLAGLKNKWLNVIGLQIKGIRRSNNKECT